MVGVGSSPLAADRTSGSQMVTFTALRRSLVYHASGWQGKKGREVCRAGRRVAWWG